MNKLLNWFGIGVLSLASIVSGCGKSQDETPKKFSVEDISPDSVKAGYFCNFAENKIGIVIGVIDAEDYTTSWHPIDMDLLPNSSRVEYVDYDGDGNLDKVRYRDSTGVYHNINNKSSIFTRFIPKFNGLRYTYFEKLYEGFPSFKKQIKDDFK